MYENFESFRVNDKEILIVLHGTPKKLLYILVLEKRFYNRETNSAAFCVIQQMFIKPLLPHMQLK
jgi:hypothetical protein